jgi:hypothetical protein
MQKLLKSIAYTEYDDLDWATNVMDIDIKTAVLQDQFKMGGKYSVTPLDGGARCRREFKGEVKVSIPLIGGRVEKYMLDELKNSYDKAAVTTRRWIAKAKENA